MPDRLQECCHQFGNADILCRRNSLPEYPVNASSERISRLAILFLSASVPVYLLGSSFLGSRPDARLDPIPKQNAVLCIVCWIVMSHRGITGRTVVLGRFKQSTVRNWTVFMCIGRHVIYSPFSNAQQHLLVVYGGRGSASSDVGMVATLAQLRNQSVQRARTCTRIASADEVCLVNTKVKREGKQWVTICVRRLSSLDW